MNKCLGALGFAAALGGCTVGPDYHTPDIALPDSFLPPVVQIAQKTSRRPGVNITDWWQSLHDPLLDSLVSRAIESAGTVKKKLGFSLTSVKPNDGVRRYRIETRRVR